tara:strand:+ start:9788 stop:10093 length:306 start_codon:yes stop_codon:yes gene_type:complete
MPGYHPYKTDKKPYASNPHGGKHNYAGKGLTMLTDLKESRQLTPEEKKENADVVEEYERKKTLLTGSRDQDNKEKKELTKQKPKKKKQTISKTKKVHTVYV